MKYINWLMVGIIALLSVAAGVAKVMQTPEEMQFLQSVGLSTLMIMAFGAVQIFAGVLLVPEKSRIYGATLAALAFLLSTVLIVISGNLLFAAVSAIPVLLAAFVIYQNSRSAYSQ